MESSMWLSAMHCRICVIDMGTCFVRLNCMQDDAEIFFMWPGDIVGVARFIDACLKSVHISWPSRERRLLLCGQITCHDPFTLRMCQASGQKACLELTSNLILSAQCVSDEKLCQDKSTLAHSRPPSLSEPCVDLV